MTEKYVKLKHVKELINLIDKRDGYLIWTDDYEKYDKKVKNTVDWLERNAKTFENSNSIDTSKKFYKGQRVKITNKLCGHNHEIGEIVVLKDVREAGIFNDYWELKSEAGWYFNHKECIPCED